MNWADAAIAGLLLGLPLALLAVAVGIHARWAGGVPIAIGAVGVGAALIADELRSLTALGAVPNGVGVALVAFGLGSAVQLLIVARRSVLGDMARPPVAWLALAVLGGGLATGFAGSSPRVGPAGRSFVLFDGPTVVGAQLVAAAVAAVVIVGFALATTWHRTLPLRLAGRHPELLARVGRNPRMLLAVVIGISSATAALAGVLTNEVAPVAPGDGLEVAVLGLEAAVIGTVGSVPGAVLGGVALGLARLLGDQARSGWGPVAGHLLTLLIVLLTRRRALRRLGPAVESAAILTGGPS